MLGSWACDIANALSRDRNVENTKKLLIGKVVSVEPISIEVCGQVVTRNIYANSAMLFLSDNEGLQIQSMFDDNPAKALWFDMLLKYHKLYVLKPQDEVVVMQNETSFYILQKVARI